MKNEMKIMKILKHPNIIQVHDVTKTTSMAYIFMDLAKNGSISDELENTKRPIAEPKAKKYFRDIIAGLYYMHTKGVAHRDIKPDNFLISESQRVLITDFGFSCVTIDGTERLMKGTACGTSEYKAIEIKTLREGEVYDAKASDMYSLGVSLMTESAEEYKELIGQFIANNKYKVIKYMASGSFCAIFKVKEMNTNKELVAKLEAEETDNPQLSHEFRIYQLLRYECNHSAIPKTYFFGSFLTYRALVMEQFGPNIATKFQECNQKFGVKTVSLLAIQLMDIFKYIHSKRVIYRDVKPENILLGLPQTPGANLLHVVDFGLSKEYKDRNGVHIPYKENVGLNGTARYMSINTH
ncbi:unnamed protein product, partial [Medioppia subpectinata]